MVVVPANSVFTGKLKTVPTVAASAVESKAPVPEVAVLLPVDV
jgi:hypothetical protein